MYWKDPSTSDTWGLNFTSPIDAKQFRECCVSRILFAKEQTKTRECFPIPGRKQVEFFLQDADQSCLQPVYSGLSLEVILLTGGW